MEFWLFPCGHVGDCRMGVYVVVYCISRRISTGNLKIVGVNGFSSSSVVIILVEKREHCFKNQMSNENQQ